jgi:hypothetical protein
MPSGHQVSLSDAMALLHFAEHIMFSDGMIVSTFELPHIQDTSCEVISRLSAHGCISLSNQAKLLTAENFTEKEYAEACCAAAGPVQEDLLLLDGRTLSSVSKLADFSTKPLGVNSPAMEKWITSQWHEAERHSLAEEALKGKARGAFDYNNGNAECSLPPSPTSG